MKPFLAIDLTNSRKNSELNGNEFLVQETTQAMVQALNTSVDDAEETMEKAKLPLAIRIFHWLCGTLAWFGTIVILSIFASEETNISEAYEYVPWVFWLTGACIIIWAILKLLSIKKEKSVIESAESSNTISKVDKACDSIFADLGVPDDARDVDILFFYYKEKNGKIKACEKGLQFVPYFNPVFKIYADEENLYLACMDGKYAFPLSSLKAIHTINQKIGIPAWNKEQAPNKEPYKQYKMTMANNGCIYFKPYYILEIEFVGESFGIYFPCYELPVFEEVTGIKTENKAILE